MKITEQRWRETIDVRIESVNLGFRNLVAYRRTKLDMMIPREGRKPSGPNRTVTEGICSRAELSRLQRDVCLSERHLLVEPTYLEEVFRYGYATHYSPYFGNYDKDGSYGALSSLVSKTPFTDTVSGRFPRELLYVYDDFNSHMLFDERKEPLPVALFMEYISGNICNDRFDLKKVFEILSQRDDVENLEEIRIPYYNAEEGRDQAVQFIWTPSVEDYRRCWKACLKDNPRYPSTSMEHTAVWRLDLFGIKKSARTQINAEASW